LKEGRAHQPPALASADVAATNINISKFHSLKKQLSSNCQAINYGDLAAYIVNNKKTNSYYTMKER
jgi:hypothetical protein